MSSETQVCCATATACATDKKAAKRKQEEHEQEEEVKECQPQSQKQKQEDSSAEEQEGGEEVKKECEISSATGAKCDQAKDTSNLTEDQKSPLKSLDEWDDWKAEYVKKQDCKQGVIEADKPKENFRNYVNSSRQERVSKFYTLQHQQQTLGFSKQMVEKYASLSHFEMTVWEALEYLSSVVDDSDPDTDLSQLQHALQTAEACRKKFPGEQYDWLHLTGLIHDLGKILAVKNDKLNLPGEPQWAVVGDTFPLGAPFSDKNILPASFKDNPDYSNAAYNTGCGIYEKGCGLSSVTMSWGHDEYIYRVVVGNKCALPMPALYILRYHSFYPWHREGAYVELTNEQDREMLYYVKEFNECDLYSKSENPPKVEELAPYYKGLIDKYMPGKLHW